MLNAQQMKSLPSFFKTIPDPRRGQGRRHRLPTVLAIAAGATLCGMRGYLAMSDWAQSLSQTARARFRCRYDKGKCNGSIRIRTKLQKQGNTHLL